MVELRTALCDLAERHRETLVAAQTHTQPAQPTTIAHYLLAVIEQLERDSRRLQAAYATTNRSPLGACAITGTGFPIDRELTSALLGIRRPDRQHLRQHRHRRLPARERCGGAACCSSGLGRFVQDLLLWCTVEFGYLRLADGFVQCSSIMPQKRNPVALEHARAIASKAVGQAAAIATVVHNTPFGDIVDTEDDLQPLVASAFRDAVRAVTLVAASLRGAELDVARLEARAAEGGTTLTELADHLVRTHNVPFTTAHAIAARLMQARRRAIRMRRSARCCRRCRAICWACRCSTPTREMAEIMSPRHFVEVRTTPGGPAPAETTRALLANRATQLAVDRAWLDATPRGGCPRQRAAESPERGAMKVEPTYVRVLVVWVAVLRGALSSPGISSPSTDASRSTGQSSACTSPG